MKNSKTLIIAALISLITTTGVMAEGVTVNKDTNNGLYNESITTLDNLSVRSRKKRDI